MISRKLKVKVIPINLELKVAFDKAQRFNNKIFINKTGPLFGTKMRVIQKSKDTKKKTTNYNTETNQMTLKPQQIEEDENKKKKFKETYATGNSGFTLGIAPSKLNLRKKRKEEYRKAMRSFEDIFQTCPGVSNPRSPSEVSSERSATSDDDLKAKPKEVKTIKAIANEFHCQRTKKLEIVKELKKKKEIEKQEDIQKMKDREERIANNPKVPMYRTRSYNPKKIEREVLPGPASYDVRGNLDLTKGYTFGSKNYKQMAREKHTPDFVLPRTDIEMILDRPKFAETRSERFKEKPLYIPPSAEHISK
jgi:hypothetical protein